MISGVITVLIGLLVVMTALPFLTLSHGFIRVCDFPRQQIAALAILLLVLWTIDMRWGLTGTAEQLGWWLPLVLAAVVLVQMVFIIKFTRLWPVQSLGWTGDPGAAVSVMTSNVKQSNRQYGRLASLIREVRPDILVLMEVDEDWQRGLADELADFEFRVEQPQSNTYGMILASRLPIEDARVQYLLTDGVPSIIATIRPEREMPFRLYCLHPEPPLPHLESVGRDAETVLAARMAREETLPVAVTGDLNDVAWSYTTRRFQRISRLLDPRVGRGMFNSFDARFYFMRWPLDHLFHSGHFRLKGMRRLTDIGSDHFPMFFDLVLTKQPAAEVEPEPQEEEDVERADHLIAEARKRDERPVGEDWED